MTKTISHSITIPMDTFNKFLEFRRHNEFKRFDLIDLPISTVISLILEWSLDKNRVTHKALLELYGRRAKVYGRVPTRPRGTNWETHLLDK